ncbi:MAG: baseplate J/gp47 family protein [Anaerolineales bacterium]
MKIQIIYLDPHDDYGTARDKLNWAKAPRVVLVWPGRGSVLARQLDLVLLQRYASNHGTAIGLVTHDPEVRDHADALGIPVFDTLDHVSEGSWFTRSRPRAKRADEKSRIERPTPSHRETSASNIKLMRAGILVMTFFILLLLSAALIPTADVYLTPKEELQSFILEQQVDFSSSANQPVSEAFRQENIIVEGNLRGTTSGLVEIPIGFAEGEVLFSNNSDGTVTVPAGTILLTEDGSGLQFVTLGSIELKPEAGAEETVDVRAVLPGSQNNVGGEIIQLVDGRLAELVSVRNPEEFTGGTEESRSAVTSSDLIELREALTKELLQEAEEIISAELFESEEVLPESWRTVRIIDDLASNAVGDAVDTTSIEMSFEASVIIIAKQKIEEAILDESVSHIPDGHVAIPGTQEIDTITSEFDTDSGNQIISIQVEQRSRPVWNSGEIIALIKLKPVDAAENILFAQYDLAGDPQIISNPAWLPILPWLDLAYEIHYQQVGTD